MDSWIETHHEIVAAVTRMIDIDSGTPRVVEEIYGNQGTGGIYDLCVLLTNQFETEFTGRDWDGEYFEELENFLSKIMAS